MGAKSLTVAVVVGLGLMVVLGPKLANGAAQASAAQAGLGNCYSEAQDYLTPVLCE